MQLKSNMEDDLINMTKQNVENKHTIGEFDRILSEIKQDREKRKIDQQYKKDQLTELSLASQKKHQ